MLRSGIYRYFIVFFFSFALLMSGCRTLKVAGEVNENQDTIKSVKVSPNDSLKKDNDTADIVNTDTVSSQNIIIDTLA